MLKKSSTPHFPDSASGTLTPSFGHCYAVSKQEEGSTSPVPTLRKYLDQAEKKNIKQSFILGRSQKFTFFRLHCCDLVQRGVPCSPPLTLDSQYIQLLSKGALANTARYKGAALILPLKMACCLVIFFQTHLFTSSSSD